MRDAAQKLRKALRARPHPASRIDVAGRSNVIISRNEGSPGSSHSASAHQDAPIIQTRRRG
jgi:hypothetical protein